MMMMMEYYIDATRAEADLSSGTRVEGERMVLVLVLVRVLVPESCHYDATNFNDAPSSTLGPLRLSAGNNESLPPG